jgi:hypothetical protein
VLSHLYTQDVLDRRAVCDTVTVPDTAAVACGVTALQLIEQFAGTATKQSVRIKELESEVNKLVILLYFTSSTYRYFAVQYLAVLFACNRCCELFKVCCWFQLSLC